METKDWIMFFAQLVLSGLFVFILQIMYERRRSVRREYSVKYLEILDKALNCYARSTINGEERSDELRSQFYQGAIDCCNFYLANHKLFKKFTKRIFEIRNLLGEFGATTQSQGIENALPILSKIYEIMLSIKEDCMFYKF